MKKRRIRIKKKKEEKLPRVVLRMRSAETEKTLVRRSCLEAEEQGSLEAK